MINYRILPEQKLIAVCIFGKTTLEEILKFSQDLRNDPDYCQSYDTILNNTQTKNALENDDVRKLSFPRIDASKPVGKIATIAPADITFAMSRMHEIVAETHCPYEIYVFRDTASALKWLGREGLDIESIFEEIKAGSGAALDI